MASRALCVLLIVGFVYCNSVNSYKISRLSCNQIRSFVDGHNNRRLQLAKGAVSGQPPASNMKYMVWDDELAKKAAGWAAKNVKGHNPSRSLNSRRFDTGENIYWYKTTDSEYVFNSDQALKSWFDEHKNYKYAPMQWSDFQRPYDKQIGHYTQMAWSETVYVGCAISEALDGIWKQYKVVCNYGPAGNYIGQTPYERKGQSGNLVCSLDDCSKPYGDTC